MKNDGTKKINKTAVTLWLADFVGGDGDSNDDKPDFDLIRDIAFSFDADGVSNNPAFKGVFVGGAATLYLEMLPVHAKVADTKHASTGVVLTP